MGTIKTLINKLIRTGNPDGEVQEDKLKELEQLEEASKESTRVLQVEIDATKTVLRNGWKDGIAKIKEEVSENEDGEQ